MNNKKIGTTVHMDLETYNTQIFNTLNTPLRSKVLAMSNAGFDYAAIEKEKRREFDRWNMDGVIGPHDKAQGFSQEMLPSGHPAPVQLGGGRVMQLMSVGLTPNDLTYLPALMDQALGQQHCVLWRPSEQSLPTHLIKRVKQFGPVPRSNLFIGRKIRPYYRLVFDGRTRAFNPEFRVP